MTVREFADEIIRLPAEKQNEFFEALKGKVSEDEWMITVKYISLWSMYNSPAKYNAIKNAVCETLCEEIFGHSVERSPKTEDPCNPVYMTSIL